MRITTLLLDLDGVLRLWPADHSALEEEHGLPRGSVRRTAFEPELLEQAVTGRITDNEWRSLVMRDLALAYPSSRAKEAVIAWSRPAGTISSEVLSLVSQVRKHCQVGLVTNATDRLNRDLESLGVAHHFDFIVNSSEAGFSKPSPEIFMHALALSGASPSQAVFVDDTASHVSAARALGIRSYHFASAAELGTFLQSVGLLTNAA